jgi:hypothetical protein
LQESDKERPSIRPTGTAGVVVSKDVRAASFLLGQAEECDQNDENASRCPVDADFVDEVEIPRAEEIDEETNKQDSPEC